LVGENCIMRNFIIGRFTKYCYDDHVKEDEIGRACRMHGRDKNMYKILIGRPEGKRPL